MTPRENGHRLLALAWPELRTPDADPRPFEPMLDALDDLSPRVEAVDLGVALVDITGLGPMWGPERKIAACAVMLARGVAPLAVRAGIGDNRWMASLAARLARFERPEAPAAFRTLERDELPNLPLTLLPADAATRQRFALFGLTEMRQLAELPRSAVGAQFGPVGERLQALARGHDPRPLVPRRRPERVEAGATFDPPLDGVDALGLTLRRLSAELCERLEERHLAPGRAALTLQLEDAPAIRVAQPFPQPALEPDWIARLLLSRLEAAARGWRPSLPDANQDDLRRANGPRVQRSGAVKLGNVMPETDARRSESAIHTPKATSIGIWQDPAARAPAARARARAPAARARAAATFPSEGTTSAIRPPSTARRPGSPTANLRESMVVQPVGAGDQPKDLASGPDGAIWQTPAGVDVAGPDERPEPRVASVHLAFDRLADPATRQLPAFEARAGRWEELRWSLERIRHRFGSGRLWRAEVDRPTAALPEHRSRLMDIGS